MTDRELEARLRSWYRDEIDENETAPVSLRMGLSSIVEGPSASVSARSFSNRRGLALLAAAALLAALAIAGALVVGSGLLRQFAVVPPSPLASFNASTVPLPSATTSASPTPSEASPTPSPTPTEASQPPSPTTTASPTPKPSPTPSAPDLIAVYHLRGTSADIFTLDVATGERTPLGSVPVDGRITGRVGKLEWSADRRTVAVSRIGDGPQVQARIDVTEHSVTPVGDGRVSDTVASPHGDRLVGVDGGAGAETIVVVDFEGKELQPIALPAGATVFGAAVWSPDGTSILVSGCLPCNLLGKGPAASTVARLFIVPLDGRPIRRVGGSTTEQWGPPRWSPDMSKVVLPISCQTTCRPGIATIDVADGRVRHLTARADDAEPVWTDDGTRIAFVRAAGAGRGIWVMEADGRNATRLTTAAADYGERAPVWSPDGASILFSKGTGAGIGDVWVVPSNGGKPRLLLADAVADW